MVGILTLDWLVVMVRLGLENLEQNHSETRVAGCVEVEGVEGFQTWEVWEVTQGCGGELDWEHRHGYHDGPG